MPIALPLTPNLSHSPPKPRASIPLLLAFLAIVGLLTLSTYGVHDGGSDWGAVGDWWDVQRGIARTGLEQVGGTPEVVGASSMDPYEGLEGESELPTCDRTMLFRFSGLHGFGSEFLVLLRHAALARYYGYTLLLDSSKWNYGDWNEYFLPLKTDCVPPVGVRRMKVLREGWEGADHVESKRDVDGLDRTFIRLFVDANTLESMNEIDGGSGKEETFPEVFKQSFEALEDVLREIWRLNPVLTALIEDLQATLGMGGDFDASRSQAGDLSVAIHVRLGDKYLELNTSPESSPGLASDVLGSYLSAARSSIDALLSIPPLSLDAADTSEWEGGQPNLVLMSDDTDAWKMVDADERSRGFKVVGTGSQTVDLLKSSGGFHETKFNSLPLQTRVELTQSFLRDLTVLSTKSDALVITASSNTGRLMALLAGREKSFERGLVKSIDTRWYPTARYL